MSGGPRRERRDPPDVSGMFNLKVDNLTDETNADMLKEIFGRYGEIGDVYIPRNHATQRSRGFAFVRFLNTDEGEIAMREMDGKEIDGRPIAVQEAKEKRAPNPREAMSQRYGRERSGDRDRGYDRGRGRDNSRDRGYDRGYDRGRGRDSSRDRGYGRGGDRDRDRDRDRPRDRSRDRDRDRERDRSTGRDVDRTKDRSRDRSKEKERERDSERY